MNNNNDSHQNAPLTPLLTVTAQGLNLCPTLSSKRLHFKSLQQEDILKIVHLLDDYETILLLTYAPWPYTLKDAIAWFCHVNHMCETGTGSFWGIYDLEEQFLGTCGLSLFPEHEKAELHYWLGKAYWGKGYGTETAQRIITYAFENINIERLEVNHMSRNIRSQRVIEKCGFRLEGVMRAYIKRFGEFEDVKFYSLLRKEFEQNEQNLKMRCVG
ncbi:MAG: GNAT family N-acetyltransferase [Puniceicoccales bacterium]|jgi:RimJ/RimL family protein N-acetyltransferase|nr:GNAT family N-acetyltransferase [Puniceicoccales bacterium]